MASYEGWKVGDYAIRKNRLCRIMNIHFDEYPPHVTVHMLDDNSEIGTEFEKLTRPTEEEIATMQYLDSSDQTNTQQNENPNEIVNNNRQTNDGDVEVGEKNSDRDDYNDNKNNNENDNTNIRNPINNNDPNLCFDSHERFNDNNDKNNCMKERKKKVPSRFPQPSTTPLTRKKKQNQYKNKGYTSTRKEPEIENDWNDWMDWIRII